MAASEVGNAFAFDLMPDADPDERITKFANYMVETFVGDDAMLNYFSNKRASLINNSLIEIVPVD